MAKGFNKNTGFCFGNWAECPECFDCAVKETCRKMTEGCYGKWEYCAKCRQCDYEEECRDEKLKELENSVMVVDVG